MRISFRSLSVVFFLSLFFLSTSSFAAEKRQFVETVQFQNGQSAEITVVAFDNEEASSKVALQRAFSAMTRLDTELGEYENNTLWKLNHAGKKTSVSLSPEAFSLLKQAVNLSKVTDGWFDIAAPSAYSAFSQRDYRRIKLNENTSSLSFTKSKMKLDLSWILKAGMVDAAIASLQQSGFANAQVEYAGVSRHIGNDIYTPWSITLGQGKEKEFAYHANQYKLSSAAVTHIDQANAGNLIDAKNKKVVVPQIKNAFVIANSAVNATAFAVAAYSLEPLTSIRYINKHPAVHGFVTDLEGNLLTSESFAEKIKKQLYTENK
ncbi:MAG: hypothetical protein COX62_07290 [Deltaproteobacteria bacterium CG_4_10_14_0_2_um_filter_43_8]|nr:MAG: hypothetical protein COV43_08850 [Deltaproteobacteria bacterium CG11_big_fil_rev_8_21_14_0_20_42_23]PJA19104.1 MAG: hypothetical protein COX62_07290 [Deltaproteobacteria bacterium CG_4_10_14_0_2_um_filter_43_8]PJC64926.1 MAG: hypothetical protein CO021_01735 [Deltaproteobacteria bacterium CG_4_9_14_0_2_um_filter_42_21]